MPLWGSVDNAANSDIAVVQQYNMSVNTANQTLLYGNTTANAFVAGMTVGQFGVDTNEVQADVTGHGYHAGWVLRKVGSGLKAGRVTTEVLVAMGSMSSDGSDNPQYPNYRLVINTSPSSNSAQTANVTLVVSAASVPTGATLQYTWYQSYAGSLSWAAISNTSGTWYNATSPTLTANAVTANANTIRVMISSASSSNIANVYSANVTVTRLP
jgi:hypothetical protein